MSIDLQKLLFQSPDFLGAGRLAGRSPLFAFARESEAKESARCPGAYAMSLNGDWNFQYHTTPTTVPDDCDAVTCDDAKWDKIDVPSCWDMRGYDKPHYTNVMMPWDNMPPHAPVEDNPTGVYRRTFEIPEAWQGRRVVLHFDGVESFFAASVNGQCVGYGKDSRASTEFDVTAFVKPGRNQITVVVVKWSDSCFIEDQDQWWHGGIVRNVYLRSTGKAAYIEDVFATATLDESFTVGKLKIKTHFGFAQTPEKWTVNARLYAPSGKPVWNKPVNVPVELWRHDLNRVAGEHIAVDVPNVRAWSAESPSLYTLTISLVDPEGHEVESTVTRIGFRSVEVRNRQMLINGQPVLICGVNRHEHDEKNGRTVSVELTRRDLEIMKRFNINAIRTCHYPSMPEFFDLCDEYGFYVIDEANIESHAFYHDMPENPLWAAAFTDRATHLVTRDKNHACVIAWSLGNESGSDANHAAMAGWIRHTDPSRLVHYEGSTHTWAPNINRHLSDFICPMYPAVDSIIRWAEGFTDDPRPMIMCEYSHAMGNSNGSLKDYFAAFEKYSCLQGGFIWEWLDHGIKIKTNDGKEGYNYGGDFGDTPHDSNFVADGMIWPNREAHPGLYEFKKLAQPVKVAAENLRLNRIRITNLRYFTNLEDLECSWELAVDGTTVQLGKLGKLKLPPRPSRTYRPNPAGGWASIYFSAERPNSEVFTLPLEQPEMTAGQECFLTVRFKLARRTSWGEAGHEVAFEQFKMPYAAMLPAPALPDRGAIKPQFTATERKLSLGKMALDFDAAENFMTFGAEKLLLNPPELNIWRGPTDNDGIKAFTLKFKQTHKPLHKWHDMKLWDVARRESEMSAFPADEEYAILNEAFYAAPESDAGIRWSAMWRLGRDGAIHLASEFDVPQELADLPRLGLVLELPADFTSVRYFGRGPQENQSDRDAGYPIGLYDTTVDEMHVPYIMPQENGNRTAVRYAAIANAAGTGLLVTAPETMEFSVSRFTAGEFYKKMHEYELTPSDRIYLKLDLFQRGVGTASCGPDTREEYRLGAGKFGFNVTLYPFAGGIARLQKLIRSVR